MSIASHARLCHTGFVNRTAAPYRVPLFSGRGGKPAPSTVRRDPSAHGGGRGHRQRIGITEGVWEACEGRWVHVHGYGCVWVSNKDGAAVA